MNILYEYFNISIPINSLFHPLFTAKVVNTH
nr:MAG TPA: hypothetical protein [Caudoviricetes sp.]